MLPETIELTDGTDEEIFGSSRRTASGTLYTSASPKGDLQGAPSLRVETTKTSKNIERTVVQLTRPIWDETTGRYVWYVTANVQLNRHVSLPVEGVLSDLKKILSLPEEVVESVADAAL